MLPFHVYTAINMRDCQQTTNPKTKKKKKETFAQSKGEFC